MRGLTQTGLAGLDTKVHVLLEHSNRGKKSLALDLTTPEGRDMFAMVATLPGKFVQLEGGAKLNASMVDHDLVDEINLTLCPRIVGGRTAPTIADGIGSMRLADSRDFKITSARRVHDELFLVLRRAARKS